MVLLSPVSTQVYWMETCYNTVRLLSIITLIVVFYYACLSWCITNRKDRNFGAVHRRDISDSVNGYVSWAYCSYAFYRICSHNLLFLVPLLHNYSNFLSKLWLQWIPHISNNVESRLYPVRLFRCIVKISCHCYSVRFYLFISVFLFFYNLS